MTNAITLHYSNLTGFSFGSSQLADLLMAKKLNVHAASLLGNTERFECACDTADPSKAAVAARHQQERLQRNVYSHVATQSEPTNMAAPPPVDPAQGQTPDFQKARAHREHYLARMAEMEFRKAQGELVEISFVQKAAYDTARSLYQSLMSMSPQLAPQLAAMSDPWEVERQLTAALRQRLNEAAQVSSDDFGFALSEC